MDHGGTTRAGHGDMAQHMQQMYTMHLQHLWAHFASLVLGVWLITSPAILGSLDPGNFGPAVARVTAERGLASPEARAWVMMWSDIIAGCLIVVFAGLSLFWRFRWAQWGTTCVGLWLLFAPLVFWSPTAAAANNDLLVGSLAIAFSILIPMMPGMSMESMMAQEDIPPGWDYSPSSWSQRLPIIALAFVGFFIARYLTAYQLGHITTVWDPFFGEGTARIITSDVSKAWPVADAGLGAVSYLLEALSGMMGDRRRWRTMPWMVGMFGVLVIPLGGVSIFFIIIQPIVIGTWCTLCLAAALAMVVMIPYSLDELVAMGQFLVYAKRAGKPFWRTFFMGDAMPGGAEDKSSGFRGSPGAVALDMARGVTLSWPLVLNCAIGVWLMFTRITLGASDTMANSDHFVGALVITLSVIAMAEVARVLRFINLAFAFWLVLAPWIVDGATVAGTWASVVAGVLLAVLAFPRGPIANRYAGWDRVVF